MTVIQIVNIVRDSKIKIINKVVTLTIPPKQSWLDIKKKVYHTCITLTKKFIDKFNK